MLDGDGCSDCLIEFCGDGVVNNKGTEECDDGNIASGDGCTSGCITEFCGDGIVNNGGTEECDDGNDASGDGCSSDCVIEFCGDGIVNNRTETCDDGDDNTDSGATGSCTTVCRRQRCGDGLEATDEECDDGTLNTDTGAEGTCTTACTFQICGDSYRGSDEECDDGNEDSGDGCSSACVIEFCGDGTVNYDVDIGLEDCDDGATNTDTGAKGSCTTSCKRQQCGDGLKATDEDCDDGTQNTDTGAEGTCRTVCTFQICGDFYTGSDEECDDGNTVSGDGCSDTCVNEFCGDGDINNAGNEECDDGNTESGDGCDSDCTIEVPTTSSSTTTAVPTSSSTTSTPVPTTSSSTTTAALTSSSTTSTPVPTTSSSTTTVAPTSSSTTSTPVPTTSSSTTTVAPTSSSTTSTPVHTTSSSTTTVAQTSSSTTSTPVPTTSSSTTTAATTSSSTTSTPVHTTSSSTPAPAMTTAPAVCGDGLLNTGVEECDDGDTVSGDGCSDTCMIEFCGDGTVNGVEECDDGTANNLNGGADGSCRSGCKLQVCGDGDQGSDEECDDGDTISGDGCSQTCMIEFCGDGTVNNKGVEECDDGTANHLNGGADGSCRPGCKLQVCGDGDQGSDEECDDGNTVSGDGCSQTCMIEFCGDGTVNGVEECDDGTANNLNGGADGSCRPGCKLQVCGDGDQGSDEECDDMNTVTTDACPSECKSAFCGDGYLHQGLEVCGEPPVIPCLPSDSTPIMVQIPGFPEVGRVVHGFHSSLANRIVLYNLHDQFSTNELVLSISVRNQMCEQDSPEIRITADLAGEDVSISTSAVGPNTAIEGIENGGNPLLIVVARFSSLSIFGRTSLPRVSNEIFVVFKTSVHLNANSNLRLSGFSAASGPASLMALAITEPSGVLESNGQWDLASGVLEIRTLAKIPANEAVVFSFTLINPGANMSAASVSIGCNRCSFDDEVDVETGEAPDSIFAVSLQPPTCTSGNMALGSSGPFGPKCEYTCNGVRSGPECLCAPGRFGYDCSQRGVFDPTNSAKNATAVETDEQVVVTSATGTGVTFPAGSVMRTLAMSVASYTVTDLKVYPHQNGMRSVSVVAEPTPSGERLALPVEVTVAVSMTVMEAEQAQQRVIQLAFLDPSSGLWRTVPSSLDSATGHVRGQTDLLSPWTVMSVDPRVCNAPQFGRQCQNTCYGSLDATARVCLCPPGRFGFDCSQQATRNPAYSVNPTPVAAGAAAEVKSSTGAGVSIPAGATTSDIVVEVTGYDIENLAVDPSQSATLKSVSVLLDMKPEGVRFAVPVTLSIPVDLASLAAERAAGKEVNMAFLDLTTGLWDTLSSSFDQDTGMLSAETTHFSQWTAMSVTPAAAEEDDSDSGGWAAWKWALVGVAIGIVVLLLLYFLWTRMKSKKPANVQQYAAEPVKTRSIAENFPEPSRFLEPELPDPSRFKLQHFTPEPKLRHITPAPEYELDSSLVFEVSTYFQAVPSETRMPPGVVLMGSVPPMVGSVPPIVGSVPQVVGSLPVMIPGSTPPMMPARLVAMPPTPPRVGGTVPPTQFPVAVWSP